MNINGLTLATSAVALQTPAVATDRSAPMPDAVDVLSKSENRAVNTSEVVKTQPQEPTTLSPEDAARMVEQLNKTFMPINDSMQFHVDQDSGKMVFAVKDGKTGETIRQIPQEVLLKISKNLTEYLQRVQTDIKQTGGQSLPSGLITDITA